MSLLFILLACALVNGNDLQIDAENLRMRNGEDDEWVNEAGHEYSHMVDIEDNSEAEPEIHDTGVDGQNIHTPNEGNAESVTVPGPDQHIDIVEEDPANGDLAARVKFGSKVGSLAASTSVAGIIPMIFNNSGNYHGENLYDKLLLGSSILFILISFVFGVVLLQGRPFFHLQIFPINNPKSIGRIKFVTGVAIVSITMVLIFGLALIIRRAF